MAAGLISEFHLRMSVTAKQQLGEFDSGIFCADCDGLLGRFDDYVLELCQKFEQLHTKPHPEPLNCRKLTENCSASLCFRCYGELQSVKRPSVAVVRLGPYEKKFRDVIFSSRSIDELPEAEIIFSGTPCEDVLIRLAMYFYPTRFKMADLNFYNFAVGGFRIRTKVDNRPLPKELISLSSGPVWGTFTVFEETSEFQRTIDLMKRHPGQ